MKIAFVMNRGYSLFHPEHPEAFGGAQIDQYLLGQALCKKGYQVSFIVHDYGQIEKENINDYLTLYKSYPPKGSGSLLVQFFRALKRLYRTLRQINADVYFMEGANFELCIVAIFCWLNRKILYYRIASDIEADGRYVKNNVLQGFLFKLGLRLTTKIIVQTEYQQLWLKKQGYQATIIPNAYPVHSDQGNMHGPILWVGRLIRIKRPEILLEIAKLLPDRQFTLIGQAETIDGSYAIDIIEKMGKIKNITYVPRVAFSKVDTYYQKSSMLINTSTYEGLPMTFLQAMSFGLPIITFGVNPDNLLEKIHGSCVTTVAEGILAIRKYTSPKNWEHASTLSKIYFSDNFSLDTVVAKYEQLFKKQL
ncbi:MAG: glycosyltransferase family 4 protein [Patescibacteria group bacterium]